MGLLHPTVGQGFVAFRALQRSPRRGSHPPKTSPRQQPHRISAAVAFLPLPSRSRARRRVDSMKLRSAEADPHVTEHRGVRVAPKRSSTAAQSPLTGADTEVPAWTRRPDHLRAGQLPRPLATLHERPKASLWCYAAEATSLSNQGCTALTEVSGVRARRSFAKQPTTRLYSADESVVVAPPLPAARHSFLP